LFPGFHTWSTTGTCGSVDFAADLYVESTGNFRFGASGYNNNLVVGWDILFDGRFDGVQYVNVGTVVDRDSSFGTSYGFYRPEYKSNYLEFLKKTLHMHVETR
ncbi:MAG TPA: hypothetical protein VFR84_03045, partial [Candidatus Angelobacter sp.]|nr:hypothetical protein [Candidatus Angelobacter sp.]